MNHVDDENKGVRTRTLLNSTMLEEKLCDNVSSYSISVEKGISSSNFAFPPDEWSTVCVDYYSQYWNLNSEQVERLWELHNNIEKDFPMKRYPFQCAPSMLIRFLLFYNFHVKKTEHELRKVMAWRELHQVDCLLETYQPPQLILNKYVGAVLEENDRVGDPVFISRTGCTDTPAFLDMFGSDEFYRYEIFKRESAIRGEWIKEWEIKAKRPIRQIIIIDDFQGLSRRMLASNVLSFFSKVMRMDQECYPNCCKKIIVIRAPFIFRAAWSLMKRVFEPSVVEKMEFCGSDYLKTLEKHMELHILPTCFYPEGRGRAVEGFPISFEGGRLSDEEKGFNLKR
eukprot:CAMPEP_0194224984 /NCGR_PEP_ID=MMETSP0156-20130528/38610_1 /TAXON_ID=33649 /ORGANISM="Thalassionema nitzschioides, Strain L26-B" /LENGTH=339 /DNA_ID=CAMNT_0038956761 /DNA_START=63 /DNA_END=1079 /DNA_ORIENTATION=-